MIIPLILLSKRGLLNLFDNTSFQDKSAIDAAANKNYVDNGGAITKLPNDSFTAVSDIDFDGFSLKNIPDPIDEKGAANKAYVDDKTIQPAAPIKPIITVWAEEKGPLGDGHYKFSFGNGSSGNKHAYGCYYMSASGRII